MAIKTLSRFGLSTFEISYSSDCLLPFNADKDVTDRLIISLISYLSFRSIELMDELERSLKYVLTYQIFEQIRKEERKISKKKLAIERYKIKSAQEKAKEAKEQLKLLALALLEKDVDIKSIYKIKFKKF